MSRHRSHLGHVVAAAAIVAGGLGVGVVEALRFPRGTVWIVVGVTVALMVVARSLTRR